MCLQVLRGGRACLPCLPGCPPAPTCACPLPATHGPAEYGLLWATFGAIMQWGLEAGIAAGIVLATIYFAWGYAQVGETGKGPVQQAAGSRQQTALLASSKDPGGRLHPCRTAFRVG